MRSSNFHFVIHCTALELVWDRKHEYFTRNLANVVFRHISRQLKYFAQDVFLYQHGSVFWMCFSLFFLAVLTLDLNWQVQPPIYCYFLVCPAELVAVKYSIYFRIVNEIFQEVSWKKEKNRVSFLEVTC